MKTAIGIDIGGTNIKIVCVSEKGEVLEKFTEPTNSNDIIQRVADNVRKFVKPGVTGIGFGIAGIIDRKCGVVLESPNIASLNNSPVKEIFEKEFSLPVVVENDANAYAYGEKWIGTGRDFHTFVVLTLGTGLGGGLIYKDELFEGPMEVGHMVINPDSSGRFCTCGSFGCLEAYVSGRAIVNRVITLLEEGAKSILRDCCEGNFYKMTPEHVYKTALEGDNLSRDIFRETGRYLGIGIANLINIFSPDAVILGGGLIGSWDLFIEELRTEVSKRALEPLSQNVEILKTTFQEGSGAIGAAGLVFKRTSPLIYG